MTGPALDPVADYLAARQSVAADPVAEYMRARSGTPKKRDIHEEYRSGDLARRMARENANEREQMESEEPDRSDPSAVQKALGGVASIAREIPGAEFLQAGARSLVRRQPYGEALNDIRGAEDALSLPVKIATRAPGAILSSAVLPGSNLAKGAMYGALRGFTDPEPDADRASGTVAGGVLGGALGAGADAVGAVGGGLSKLLRKQGAKESKAARALINALKRPAKTAPSAGAAPSGLQLQSPIGPVLQPRAASPAPPAASPASAPAVTPPTVPVGTIDDQITSILDKLRAKQPHETGNVWGDAEIAMGKHLPEPDLETLLLQSLQQAKPRLVRSP